MVWQLIQLFLLHYCRGVLVHGYECQHGPFPPANHVVEREAVHPQTSEQIDDIQALGDVFFDQLLRY